jgi:hypothetical protein
MKKHIRVDITIEEHENGAASLFIRNLELDIREIRRADSIEEAKRKLGEALYEAAEEVEE